MTKLLLPLSWAQLEFIGESFYILPWCFCLLTLCEYSGSSEAILWKKNISIIVLMQWKYLNSLREKSQIMSVSTLLQHRNYRKKVMHSECWYSTKGKLRVISVFENPLEPDHSFVTALTMTKTKGVSRKLFHLTLIKIHSFLLFQ